MIHRALLACLLMCASLTLRALTIVDGINVTSTPAHTTFWGATAVGWIYTPTFSYDLAGIYTRFGVADGRSVTVDFYDGVPIDGGVLLRTADFYAGNDVFSGSTFTPITLLAGQTYFVGFRNVGGLGVNSTRETTATYLPSVYISGNGDPLYGIQDTVTRAGQVLQFKPILQFVSVPDNGGTAILLFTALSSLVILGGGLRQKSSRPKA